MRGRRAILVVAVLAIAAAGCGDQVRWARWRAERAMWHAQRDVDRILVQPRVAQEADYARAEAAFVRVTEGFPAAVWGRAGAGEAVHEVGRIVGPASLALARLAEVQGRAAEAIERLDRMEADWAGLEDVAMDAAVVRARTLERLERIEEALAAWEHVGRAYPALDPASGAPREGFRAALRALAAGDERLGRRAARDSLLAGAEAAYASALATARTDRAKAALADALAECRDLQGDLDGALAARRSGLAAAAGFEPEQRWRRIRDLGERSLAAGRPDSALTYARWAGLGSGGADRFAALDLEARAFRAKQAPDSALEAYARMLAEFPRLEGSAEARFQRARLLEQLDRWTLARSEYSALCATFPSHPRALEAWERVVRHLRADGERELARIETEHALASIGQIVSAQHDPAERARAVEARIAVLLAAGRWAEGVRELQGLWSAIGVSVNGSRLGLEAAEAADRDLGDRALARRLWQILASRSPDPEARRQAEAALRARPS